MKTILVVEDDDLLGKTLKLKLEHVGYQIIWAQNSTQTFEALNNHEISLIYLDILLKNSDDGFIILRKLKDTPKYKKIPVVMLSNLGAMTQIEQAIELGAADYIVKVTTSLDQLMQISEKIITNKDAHTSALDYYKTHPPSPPFEDTQTLG